MKRINVLSFVAFLSIVCSAQTITPTFVAHVDVEKGQKICNIDNKVYVSTTDGVYLINGDYKSLSQVAFAGQSVADFTIVDNDFVGCITYENQDVRLAIGHQDETTFKNIPETASYYNCSICDVDNIIYINTYKSVLKLTDADAWEVTPCLNGIHGMITSPNGMYVYGSAMGSTPFVAISADCGKTWDKTNLGSVTMNDNGAYSLVSDPNDPSFIACGMFGLIALSSDGGKTWSADAFMNALKTSEIKNLLENTFFESIVIDRNNSNVLYAAGRCIADKQNMIVFRSIDRGETWQLYVKEPVNAENAYIANSIAISDDTLFIYNGNGDIYTCANETNGIDQCPPANYTTGQVEYYNLSGVRLAAPQPSGVYIVKKYGKTYKTANYEAIIK